MKRRGRPDHSVAGKGRREELKSKERKEKEVNVFKKNAKTDEKKKKEISQRTKAKKTERYIFLVSVGQKLFFSWLG
jgi:hypothetical protein